MTLMNLTPHAIVINDITIPASGIIARVVTVDTVVSEYYGVPVITSKYGDVTLNNGQSIHDITNDIIVSGVVLDALKNVSLNINVFAPDTGNSAIRNDKGHIVTVTRLKKN